MNMFQPAFRRSFLLLSLLTVCTTTSIAAPAPDDSAAQLLAKNGSVTIANAGRFVEPGTFRIQVSNKLGRPDLTLADGTWLYHHRRISDSAAEGTLVVRFNHNGRVSSLALVTPAVVATFRNESRKKGASEFVAAK